MERDVLESPVTMSFERDGGAAVRHALAAIGAADRLVQPSSCALYVVGIDGSWYLYRQDADESEGIGSGAPADEADDLDDLGEDSLDDDGDLDDDGRLRAVERIDAAVVAALLREALPCDSGGQSWELSLEGGAGSPRPLVVRIQARPDGIALHIDVRGTTLIEPGSAGRGDVEHLGRALEQQGWRRVDLDGWSHTDSTAAASRADARILDEYVEVVLDWAGATADDALEKAGLVVSAVDALAPILRPRQLMLLTSLTDGKESSGESTTSPWFLHEDANGPWDWDQRGMGIRRRVSLDLETMIGFMGEALAARRPPGVLGWTRGKRAVGWSGLEVFDARVRVPNGERFNGRSSLCVLTGRRELSVPVERRDDGLWVSVPDDDGGDDEPEKERLARTGPISVWAEADGPTLQIRLHWSLWAYPAAAGRAEVDRALAALIRLGWKRTTEP